MSLWTSKAVMSHLKRDHRAEATGLNFDPKAALKAPIAARKCRRVLNNVRKVIGMELLCAAQGLDFLRPLRPGAGVQAAHDALRRAIPHLDRDRFLRPELEKVASVYSPLPERLLASVEKAIDSLA